MFIAIQSGEDCALVPKTGSGAAFFTMRLDMRDMLKLDPNGLQTNGNPPLEGLSPLIELPHSSHHQA